MNKRFIGKIISTKMQETAVVEVEMWKTHRIYKKRYRTSNKLKAHNPENKYTVGQEVTIQETRPLSKTKNFIIIEVEKKIKPKVTKKVEKKR